MKKFGSCLLCLAVMTSLALPSAAIDVKSGFKGAVSAVGNTATDSGIKAISNKVDAVVAKSDKITEDFTNAALSINKALELKQNKEEENAKGKNKNKKNSEVNTLESAMADLEAMLADENAKAAAQEKIKNMTEAQKAEFVKGLTNMGNGLLGYLDVATESANLILEITNDPGAAIKLGSKLKEVKKVATNAPAQAKKFGGTVKGLFQLAANAGLKVKQPTAAKTSKTKNTTDF